MEETQQKQVKKEAVTFLSLLLFMAIAVGYETVTDNRTVTKQNTCQTTEDELNSLSYKEMLDLMYFNVELEQFEEAAKLRDLIRKKYGKS